MSHQKNKPDTQANEILKTQIDVSIGAARSLINSWLPPPKPGEKMDDDQDQDVLFEKFSTGRPDRLGLGAKHLSHNEAMKLHQGGHTRQETQLKNKILNQNQRAKRDQGSGKRDKPDDDDTDDDEKEQSKSMKKKKTIGGQGDFLSMYLNERTTKKKNKTKK